MKGSPRSALLLVGVLLLGGCQTVASIPIIISSFYFAAFSSATKDAVVLPDLIADAGADILAVTDESVVLNGSASGFQLGSGSIMTEADPPLTFEWTFDTFTIADQNADGVINAADLTAASVELIDVDTAFPRLRSPIEGSYSLLLTVRGVGRLGFPVSSTDNVSVTVLSAVP